VERTGMEAWAGGAVHRAALAWSGVEACLIGEVRPLPSRCVVVLLKTDPLTGIIASNS
jgi:hypothetical protein